MGEKDITEKILEDYEDVFADIINVLLFDGEKVVRPESLSEAGVKSQYKADDAQIHEQERDVAKLWVEGGVRLSLYGLENQTAIDNDMSLRLIGYDGASYRSQMLSGRQERYPVVSLVLYYGSSHWNKSLSLKECLDIPKKLEPYFNDYKINLYEIAWLPEETIEKFTSDFKIVADFFVQQRKNNKYEPPSWVIKHVDETMKLLTVMADDPRFVNALESSEVKENRKKGAVTMCNIIDSYIDQGVEQGTQNARMEIIKNAIKGGMTDDQLINVLKFKPEEIKAVKASMVYASKKPENRRKIRL